MRNLALGSRPSPFLIGIVTLNILVFFALPLVFRGQYPSHPEDFGADWGPLTLSGQWWRILSSQFIHVQLLHLVSNMAVLWILGSYLERAIGGVVFSLIYLLCGIVGDITVLVHDPLAVTFGASSAVAGIAGGVIRLYAPQLMILWRSATIKLSFLVALPLYVVWMDISSNFFGLHTYPMVTGIILTSLFVRLSGRKQNETSQLQIDAESELLRKPHL